MGIEKLKKERVKDFLNYCTKHRAELDDSYLYGEEFEKFEPNDENPTYILIDDAEKIIGAASLVIDDYYRSGKKARFRIFHTETGNASDYKELLQAVSKHAEGMDSVFVFIPLTNKALLNMVESLDFKLWRYSFLMVKENISEYPIELPENYSIRPLIPGKDEAVWCEIRNEGFAKLPGSETPMTEEIIRDRMTGSDYLEDGALILYHQDRAIGIVQGLDDEYDNAPIMCIGPLAIIPEYQGCGLGRTLLRASINYAKQHGYTRTILCVDGKNERAKTLYLHEGFKDVHADVAYTFDLKQRNK
ncbi:GNAT family N-acetyltransferase [Sporolactobacillus laevolacticus]|uniref:GNAT family N-acetyltransferase n=1 Tax=Sporolactobacillus laevolacticus TaxID=33018 RepID=UPI0025B5F46A|nr:GNAT family N-acetyltransferase [Sporolactobacillus laevolacticus]MDN3956811.1 GNAT family N-acetyltransferase [Sporolactobacillus laevolacticus]